MDKKQLLWIILLALAAAMLLPRIFGSRKNDEQAPAPKATPEESRLQDNRWDYGGMHITAEQIENDEIPLVSLGSLNKDDGYEFQVNLDPRGASVHNLKLTGHFDTVKHKGKKNKTPEELADWSYSLLRPVAAGEQTILPFSTQYLGIGDGSDVAYLPTSLSALDDVVRREKALGQGRIAWRVGERKTEIDSESVEFTLKLYRTPEAETPHFKLIKTYTVVKGSNSLGITLTVKNLTKRPQRLSVVHHGPAGVPLESIHRGDQRNVLSGQCVGEGDEKKKIVVEKVLKREKMQDEPLGHDEALGDNQTNNSKPVVWAGMGNKFFVCLMLAVSTSADLANVDESTTAEKFVVPTSQYTYAFKSRVVPGEDESKGQMVIFASDAKTVAAEESLTFSFDVYCGPKSRTTFQEKALYDRLNYTGSIQFYSCYCLIEWLAFAVMWLIENGGQAVGNYGLIIIFMVLVIRLVLHPITKKSQVSMMKVGKLAPEMAKIKEKYKDDKQAQQQATMEFMKKHGASPILGCLPMLLQMPIWMALWAGLGASVVLRHEGLLPFWITNLAAPDTVLSWTPFTVPLIGKIAGLNFLPLLLTVFMFLQQKLTPMQSTAAATPEQRKQQKIMMYMMPVMMLLFFYNAPSGLTLYIMASTGAGVLESHLVRKHIREREALEAAIETKVAMPGKIARDRRPKKPKGPFRF